MEEISPFYPEQARIMGLEGSVQLAVHLTEDGDITAIKVAKSTGHDILALEAIRAVREASFLPATKNNKRVASILKVNLKFELK